MQIASTSALTVIGSLGVGAILGSLATAVVAGVMATRRERASARRNWLAEALAAFYGPVSAKLEMEHQWTMRVLEQEDPARNERGQIVITAWDTEVRREMARAAIRVYDEVRQIVEHNLHYVEEPTLRTAALDFLADSHFGRWTEAAFGVDEVLAEGRGTIILTEDNKMRSDFLVQVNADFKVKVAEFQKLSGGQKQPSP